MMPTKVNYISIFILDLLLLLGFYSVWLATLFKYVKLIKTEIYFQKLCIQLFMEVYLNSLIESQLVEF